MESRREQTQEELDAVEHLTKAREHVAEARYALAAGEAEQWDLRDAILRQVYAERILQETHQRASQQWAESQRRPPSLWERVKGWLNLHR